MAAAFEERARLLANFRRGRRRSSRQGASRSNDGGLGTQRDTGCENWEKIILRQFFNLSSTECEAACRATPECEGHNYHAEGCGRSDGADDADDEASICMLLAGGCQEQRSRCWDLSRQVGAVSSHRLDARGAGCRNWRRIVIGGPVAAANVHQCALRCRASTACRQFNYNPTADADEDNCFLFKAGCKREEQEDWDMYNDTSEASHQDGQILGFDSTWLATEELEGGSEWLFTDETTFCQHGDFVCKVDGAEALAAGELQPRERWQELFDALRSDAGADGCDTRLGPRVWAAARLGEAGLCSRLNNFANEVIWAMWAGLPIGLCSSEGAHDAFGLLFEDVDFPRCDGGGGGGCEPSFFTAGACGGAMVSSGLNESALVGLKRFVYSELFRFRPDVLKAKRLLTERLGLSGAPYVGVHMRRTDKIKELDDTKFASGRNFSGYIRRQCSLLYEGNQSCRVYVASDDPDALEELQAELPHFQIVRQEPLPAHLYKVRNDEGHESMKELVERNFALDLLMLIHADAFIGTASSNVGRFVFFNRSPDKASISLDDDGDFTLRNC